MDKIECIYITRTSLPSNNARSVHVMKICEQLNNLYGQKFVALVGNKYESTEVICSKYGTSHFEIKELGIKCQNKKSFYVFASHAAKFVRKYNIKKVITRDPLTALYISLMGIDVVLDLHADMGWECGRAYHIFKAKKIVNKKNLHFSAITYSLKDYYISNYNELYEKMIVIPDGVTLECYEGVSCVIPLKNDIIKIGYVGKFTSGKGIDTIIKIAKAMPKYRFYMYGGTKDDAENETGLTVSDNIVFGGYINNSKVPEIMKEMDIMMLPNKEKQICNKVPMGEFTSPIKMFEYMASGRPIIASDIPVLREVLNEQNCYFANEDDISSWIECIEYINNNRDEALVKSRRAKKDVEQYTWKKRAEKLVELIR